MLLLRSNCQTAIHPEAGLFRNLNSFLKATFLCRGDFVKKECAEELPRCERCGNPIDDCKCACPYCGETHGCTCCAGYGKATGG